MISGFTAEGAFCSVWKNTPAQSQMDFVGAAFLVSGLFDERFYLPDLAAEIKTPILRPEFALTVLVNGVAADIDSLSFNVGDVLRIENIPAGTLLNYADGELPVDDDFIQWQSLTAGRFSFVFTLFPYLELTINASVNNA